MRNILKFIVIMSFVTALQACATASVDVSRLPPATPPRFERVSVLPFVNEVGTILPPTTPDNLAGMVVAALQKDHPTLFREVTSTPSNTPGELILKGKVIKYNPGSKVARFILIGLGPGELKLDVEFINGGTGEVVEQFTTSGSIIAGGVIGASMGIDDMIISAARKIVGRLVVYGNNGENTH